MENFCSLSLFIKIKKRMEGSRPDNKPFRSSRIPASMRDIRSNLQIKIAITGGPPSFGFKRFHNKSSKFYVKSFFLLINLSQCWYLLNFDKIPISNKFVKKVEKTMDISDWFNPIDYVAMQEGAFYINIDWDLHRLADYLKRMEDMFNLQVEKEIKEIEESNWDDLPPDHPSKEDFILAITDEIIPDFFVHSFVAILWSMTEKYLEYICTKIQQQHNVPISFNDLTKRYGLVERLKLYLIAFGKFRIQKNIWKQVSEIYTIRNIIVHRDFQIKTGKGNLNNLLKRNCGIEKSLEGYVVIEKQFCEYSLNVIKTFFHSLRDEHLKRLHGQKPHIVKK
jgi:hypothetical protein